MHHDYGLSDRDQSGRGCVPNGHDYVRYGHANNFRHAHGRVNVPHYRNNSLTSSLKTTMLL